MEPSPPERRKRPLLDSHGASPGTRAARFKASWLGNAPLLGLEHLWAPRLDPLGALAVFADPVEWLLGDRLRVVVVHPARAVQIALRPWLYAGSMCQ